MRDNFKMLRAAAPYLHSYRGRTFVIKIGGELLADSASRDQVLEQVALLHSLGIQLLLVHGGAPQIAVACEKLGLETERIDGRRKTSPQVLEAVAMVLAGSLQSELLAACRRLGLPAVGLSGVSAGIVQATKRESAELDLGEVGDISAINPAVPMILCQTGHLPILAPLGCSAAGELLNINADTVASALAVAMSAEKLIFLMQLPGILAQLGDEATLISALTPEQLGSLAEEGGLSGGMLPKAKAALEAIEGGVPRVHFVSGVSTDALLAELFTNEGSGTMVAEDA